MSEQIPSNETRIQDPEIAHEVARNFWSKVDRDSAALSRRALELINNTPGSDIDKINTFGKQMAEDQVADMAYKLMHPIDYFPGVPPLNIRTSEQATEEGEWMSVSSDESADLADDRKLADIKAKEL